MRLDREWTQDSTRDKEAGDMAAMRILGREQPRRGGWLILVTGRWQRGEVYAQVQAQSFRQNTGEKVQGTVRQGLICTHIESY